MDLSRLMSGFGKLFEDAPAAPLRVIIREEPAKLFDPRNPFATARKVSVAWVDRELSLQADFSRPEGLIGDSRREVIELPSGRQVEAPGQLLVDLPRKIHADRKEDLAQVHRVDVVTRDNQLFERRQRTDFSKPQGNAMHALTPRITVSMAAALELDRLYDFVDQNQELFCRILNVWSQTVMNIVSSQVEQEVLKRYDLTLANMQGGRRWILQIHKLRNGDIGISHGWAGAYRTALKGSDVFTDPEGLAPFSVVFAMSPNGETHLRLCLSLKEGVLPA